MEIIEKSTGATFARSAEVQEIVVYSAGAILCRLPKLEEAAERGGKLDSVYDGDVKRLYLDALPARALKENLTRRDCYFLKRRAEYSWQDPGIALYIPADQISVTPAGEYLHLDFNGEKDFISAVRLEFKNGADVRRCRCERIPDAGPGWKIPDGGSWGSGYGPTREKAKYDVGGRGLFASGGEEGAVYARWFEWETLPGMLVMLPGITRREKTPERLERERLADAINAAKVFSRDVSHYEIERLQAVCNITLKEGGTV